jgi:hypothetical protein
MHARVASGQLPPSTRGGRASRLQTSLTLLQLPVLPSEPLPLLLPPWPLLLLLLLPPPLLRVLLSKLPLGLFEPRRTPWRHSSSQRRQTLEPRCNHSLASFKPQRAHGWAPASDGNAGGSRKGAT